MPDGVTVSTRARNVTAGHPAQLTSGGNVTHVFTYAHMKDTDILHKVSTALCTHSHTYPWGYKHASRNNLLHATLIT